MTTPPPDDQLIFDEEMAEQLDARYRTRDIVRRRELVYQALGAQPGDRILDAGCGPGFFVAELLEQVSTAGSVVGVDLSPQMLAAATRRCAGQRNVALQEAAVTSLPVPDASVDRALSVQVIEYVPDTRAALAELYRAVDACHAALLVINRRVNDHDSGHPRHGLARPSTDADSHAAVGAALTVLKGLQVLLLRTDRRSPDCPSHRDWQALPSRPGRSQPGPDTGVRPDPVRLQDPAGVSRGWGAADLAADHHTDPRVETRWPAGDRVHGRTSQNRPEITQSPVELGVDAVSVSLDLVDPVYNDRLRPSRNGKDGATPPA